MVPSAEGKGQWRRLVINIGGAKIWVTNIGEGKNLGKIYFQTTFSQMFLKSILLFSKMYTLHSKFTPFSLYFSFFVSVSVFFHVFWVKIKKLSSDYWGGQKRGFAPHLNYWGRVPGLPPESTPMER